MLFMIPHPLPPTDDTGEAVAAYFTRFDDNMANYGGVSLAIDYVRGHALLQGHYLWEMAAQFPVYYLVESRVPNGAARVFPVSCFPHGGTPYKY